MVSRRCKMGSECFSGLGKVLYGHWKISDVLGKESDDLEKVSDGLGRFQIVSGSCQVV